MKHEDFQEMFYAYRKTDAYKNLDEAESREDMPQVKNKDIPDMYQKLTDNGISCDVGVVECSRLKPMQDGINRDKVENMKDAIGRGEDMGHIVISKEGYIVDGHHRWVAMTEACGDKKKINAVKINLPKDAALESVSHLAESKELQEMVSTVPVKIWIVYMFDANDRIELLGTSLEKSKALALTKSHVEAKIIDIQVMLPR